MKNKLRPWQGIVIFLLVYAVLVTAGYFLQSSLGLVGMILSEVLLVLVAVGFALVFKADIKETVPVTLPPARAFFGGLMIYAGAYLATMPVGILLEILFPEYFGAVAGGLNDAMTSASPVVCIIVFALVPAICEEIVMRGVLLSSMKSIKYKAVTVIIVGLMFGVLHNDFIRLLPTAMIGMALTYIALETGSVILPVIYHFLNNAFSIASAFGMKNGTTEEAGTALVKLSAKTEIAVSLTFLAGAIPLIVFGYFVLKKKKPKLVTTLITVFLAIAIGMASVIGTFATAIKVVYTDEYQTAFEETVSRDKEIELEEGLYALTVTAFCKDGQAIYKLKNEKGETVSETVYSEDIYITDELSLEKGKYYLSVTAIEENEDKGGELTSIVMIAKIGE